MLSKDFQTTSKRALSNPKLAIVGRVKTALSKPEMETLPASCTTFKPNFETHYNILELIVFVSKALRTGAGVNIHLDNFKPDYKWRHGSITFETNPPSGKHEYTYKVSDSMETNSRLWAPELGHTVDAGDVYWPCIDDAIYYAYLKGSLGKSINFDLSNLRPAGVANSRGMVSSGPESFAFILTQAHKFGKNFTLRNLLSFLSSFNQELRRGGTYKNGALTTSMPCWSISSLTYIMVPKEAHPWLKKGLVVTKDFNTNPEFYPLIEPTLKAINDGSLWIEKAVTQGFNGELIELYSGDKASLDRRLLSNVCREVFLNSGETCDLSHLNAGQCLTFNDVTSGMLLVTEFLCQLKQQGLSDSAGIYKSSKEDKQIGVGILGLANQLAILGIKYADFTQEIKSLVKAHINKDLPNLEIDPDATIKNAKELAWAYYWGYQLASQKASNYSMKRAFVIAPTANSSYRHKDIEGFTTSPEISPPRATEDERVSETVEEPEVFIYHPESETASEVGWENQKQFIEAWQQLMETTSRAHSISFNIWEDFDNPTLDWFLKSTIKTTYYRLDIDVSFLDKSNPMSPGISCDCVG
jgi:hypothetical protein